MRAVAMRAKLVAGAALVLLVGPARAGAPAGRYTVGDKTVLDTYTGLTWQRSVSAALSYYDAASYCEDLVVDEHADWRLPTALELETLVDPRVAAPGPTVDGAAFPGTPGASFWTDTPGGDFSRYWVIDFAEGDTGEADKNDDLHPVRCVRGPI